MTYHSKYIPYSILLKKTDAYLLFTLFSLLCFKGKGQNEQKQNNNKLTLLVFNSDPGQVSLSP